MYTSLADDPGSYRLQARPLHHRAATEERLAVHRDGDGEISPCVFGLKQIERAPAPAGAAACAGNARLHRDNLIGVRAQVKRQRKARIREVGIPRRLNQESDIGKKSPSS